MVTNALEATPEGGRVSLSVESQQNSISFCVWNASVIPEDIARRIFQRNFSTKESMGRGFGTYSMKLFGEQVLGGSVQFESTDDAGTTFRFTLIT
jgi:signal transduction histidine kinase